MNLRRVLRHLGIGLLSTLLLLNALPIDALAASSFGGGSVSERFSSHSDGDSGHHSKGQSGKHFGGERHSGIQSGKKSDSGDDSSSKRSVTHFGREQDPDISRFRKESDSSDNNDSEQSDSPSVEEPAADVEDGAELPDGQPAEQPEAVNSEPSDVIPGEAGEALAVENAPSEVPEGDPELNAVPSEEALDSGDEALATEKATATLEVATPQWSTNYDYNASLFQTPTGGVYTGVYSTDALTPNTAAKENAPTIGMPTIADQNLATPTTEAPAIIQGAVEGYEIRLGPVDYKRLKDRVDPYSEYNFKIVEETGTDGTVHKKLTGFDGTYVIARLNVTNFYNPTATVPQYLHMKLEQNMALIPGMGMTDNNKGFADSLGNKTGAYLIDDLIDQTNGTPYIDVVMFSTGKLAAGADVGKEQAPTGDIPVQLYVDEIGDYNPDLKYDPASTDPDHQKKVLEKFFDDAKAALSSLSRYLLKGSDLALETAVENSGGKNKDKGTTYWSLKKALQDSYYDENNDRYPYDPGCGRTVKLISEVPVTDSLTLEGKSSSELKKRTLDVNSYDIQVANNTTQDTQTYSGGFTLRNAWLTLSDKSNTTGAEMAIGNNAKFVIDQGGKFIIDKTCQLEIEWDGATTTPTAQGQTPAKPDILNNGLLDLRAGGEIVNNGIITIEGTEGKPYQPDTQQQVVESDKGCGEMVIDPGATLTNNGAMLVYGKLYNLGTLINNGKYEDLIISNDPDKGQFAYHEGIQISWKDDVTQQNVVPGTLYNGVDQNGVLYPNAYLKNVGDVVAFPGTIENYAAIRNGRKATFSLGTATEAIIPIEPTAEAPTVVTKRITLNPPKPSYFYNYGKIFNYGKFRNVTLQINDNGSFGTLTVLGTDPEALITAGYEGFYDRTSYGILEVEEDTDEHRVLVPRDDDSDEHDSKTKKQETKKEAAEAELLVSTQMEDGAWLYLYVDKTFLMILPDNTQIRGIYDIVDNDLIFVPTDGAVVRPTKDENGNYAYTIDTPNGTPYAFTLTEEFVESVRQAQ